MGGLSRKRLQPRIVKKKKPKGQKQISITRVDPLIRDSWDQKKTLTENYESIGLKLKLKPNLRHSK